MQDESPGPPVLPPALAIPLVQAAEAIARMKPWTFMDDVDLFGVREAASGKLHVGTVLGAQNQVFAVLFYRGASGIGWLYRTVTEDEPPGQSACLEGMDFLKVEWCVKSELRPLDFELLQVAGSQPEGHGRVWPVFRSSRPGRLPWFVSEAEASQLTQSLRKAARFFELHSREPQLYDDHDRHDIPIVPEGEGTLRVTDLEWLPYLPPAIPPDEPVVLSEAQEAELRALPIRKDWRCEFIASIIPQTSVRDAAGPPRLTRLGMAIDPASHFVLAVEFFDASAPLRQCAGRILTLACLKAEARPGAFQVTDPHLARVIAPACENLDISVEMVAELKAAPEAVSSLLQHLLKPN